MNRIARNIGFISGVIVAVFTIVFNKVKLIFKMILGNK